MNILGC